MDDIMDLITLSYLDLKLQISLYTQILQSNKFEDSGSTLIKDIKNDLTQKEKDFHVLISMMEEIEETLCGA